MAATLVLSMLSSRAVWAACDSSGKILALREWGRVEGAELSASLQSKLEAFLRENSFSLKSLQDLCVLSGPGSFTGLRVSCSFMQGLATALNLKLRGIPSFRLYGEAFAIPLRALKAAELGLEKYQAAGLKFLEILGDREFKISDHVSVNCVLGFGNDSSWPDREAIERAMKNSSDIHDFEILYGYEPEYKY